MKKSRKIILSILPILGASALIGSMAIGVASCSTSQETGLNFDNYVSDVEGAGFTVSAKSTNVSVKAGESTTLTVNLSSSELEDSETITYEWYLDKCDGRGYSLIQSSSSNSYEVTSETTSLVKNITHYKYRVIAYSNNNTSSKVLSDEISLSILPTSTSTVTVSTNPTSTTTVSSGQTVTLTTSATITEGKTIGYQWFVDKGNGVFVKIIGATSETYEFVATNNGTTTLTNKYICRYYDTENPNLYLNESTVSTVKITPVSIKITSQSKTTQSVKTTEGTTLSITATDLESRTLVYDWYLSKDGGTTYNLVQSGLQKSYTVSTDALSDITTNTTWKLYANVYAWNDATTTVKSETFTLNIVPVSEAIKVSKITTDKTSVTSGEDVTMSVTATSSSSSNLTYQWYTLSSNGSTWEAISGATNSSYTLEASTISSFTANTIKTYMVVVTGDSVSVQSSNIYFSVGSDSTLTVVNSNNSSNDIKIKSQSRLFQSVRTDSSLTLFVNTVNLTGEDLTYDWYLSTDGGETYSVVQSSSLNKYVIDNDAIKDITTETTWKAYVKIYNESATSEVQSKTFEVRIKPAPEVITINELTADKTTVNPGDEVTLSVSATSSSASSTLTYQWYEMTTGATYYHGGHHRPGYQNYWSLISGATSSTYTATISSDTTYPYTKTYMVMVSGSTRAVKSQSIRLYVNSSSTSTNSYVFASKQKLAIVDQNYSLVMPSYTNWYEIKTTGDTTGLTYQWYYSGWNTNVWSKIENATSSTYTPDSTLFKEVLNNYNGLVNLRCDVYKDGELVATITNNASMYLKVVMGW